MAKFWKDCCHCVHGPTPCCSTLIWVPGLEVGCADSAWLRELCRPEGVKGTTPMMRDFVMAPPVGQSPDHSDDAADDGGEQNKKKKWLMMVVVTTVKRRKKKAEQG